MTPAPDYCLRLSQPTRAQRARSKRAVGLRTNCAIYVKAQCAERSQGAQAGRGEVKVWVELTSLRARRRSRRSLQAYASTT
eukprot:3754198-Pleurochrysis_carterae.AAC.1